MRMEKRNYVKPYIAVMNVQTEGVIATSDGEIIEDFKEFCNNNHDYFSATSVNCDKNSFPGGNNLFISNCHMNNNINYSCLQKQFNNLLPGKVTLKMLNDGKVLIKSGWEGFEK